MESIELLAPLVFVIVALIAGAILKYSLKDTKLPYTVGLFAFGLLIGILDRTGLLSDVSFFKASINFAGNIDPDMILYLFLPILIFDAAYELDIHMFRKTLGNATLLSVPGMLVTIFLTGLMMMGIQVLAPSYAAWNWTHALMFGALICATDPVAVVALLKELGVSKRFSTLVDAESLLNDGTGIVIFMIFFGTFSAAGAVDAPIFDFFYVVMGGVILGVVLGWICLWFITRSKSDFVIQNSAIIVSAYVTFFLAQSLLDVSGVIALVGYGVVIAHYGRPRISSDVNRFMKEFWDLTTYMANTLIFILVGVVIAVKVSASVMDFVILFAVYIGINVIRMVMIMMFYPIMKRSGYGLSKREALILCWGGLRGALGLTLALMVSYTMTIDPAVREQILFLTAGIVTLTLTINATTIGWLLKRLGLVQKTSAKSYLNYTIHKQLCETTARYYDELQYNDSLTKADWQKVAVFLPQIQTAPTLPVQAQDLIADIRMRVLNKEHSRYWQLYEKGIISSDSLRRLITVIEDMYDMDGTQPLHNREKLLDIPRLPFFLRWNKHSRYVVSRWVDRNRSTYFVRVYDVARGLLHAQRTSLVLIDDIKASDPFNEDYAMKLDILRQEIQQNIDRSQAAMDMVKENFPKSYGLATTQKAIRMLLSREREVIAQLLLEGMMTSEDAHEMTADITKRYRNSTPSRILKVLS